jgi:hypothetical protein
MSRPLKVAIVGTAPSTCHKAPYNNEAWQIWSLGANAQAGARFDRWFEMHTKQVLLNVGAWEPMREHFRDAGEKLTLGHPMPEFPKAKIYPIALIKSQFGDYFTSSIAYMIALAIHMNAEEIGLWGIDMLDEEEYYHQRACCEYLLGIARGKGIAVYLPPESPLLRASRMYAYEYCELSAEIAVMNKEVDYMTKKTTTEMLEANHQKSYWAGQRDMLKNIHRRFG